MSEQSPSTPEPPDMTNFTNDELMMLEWMAVAYQSQSTTEQLETIAEREQVQGRHDSVEQNDAGEQNG